MSKKPPTSLHPATPDVPAPDAVFNPDGIPVRLGSKDYTLREVPLPRLKRLREIWVTGFARFSDIAAMDWSDAATVDEIFALAEDAPLQFLLVAVPDLDTEDCRSEDHGYTLPQLMNAVDAVLRVNRLEFLRRILPFVQETLKAQTVRKNMDAARLGYERALAAKTALDAATETTPTS